MSRHGGGVSTALPRHGCVCRGCRARRFLPCHDLGQLVVSVGHGDPRVIPHGGFNFAVASFVIPAKHALLEFTGRFRSFEPEIRLRKCFYHGSCVSASQSGTREFVPAGRPCRVFSGPVGITKRPTARAAGGTAGYRGRVPHACMCLVVLPAALIFSLHFLTPARAITRCCSPRRGGHKHAPRAHAPTWPCAPPCRRRPVTACLAGVR